MLFYSNLYFLLLLPKESTKEKSPLFPSTSSGSSSVVELVETTETRRCTPQTLRSF